MAAPLIVPGSVRPTDINSELSSHVITLPPVQVGDIDVLLAVVPSAVSSSCPGFSEVGKSIRQTNVATVTMLARVVAAARDTDTTVSLAAGAVRRGSHTALAVRGAKGLPTLFAASNNGTEGGSAGLTTVSTENLLIGATARQQVATFAPGNGWTEVADHGPSGTTRPISSAVGSRPAPVPGTLPTQTLFTATPGSARADLIVAFEPAQAGAVGVYRQRVDGAMRVLAVKQLVDGAFV